MYRFKIIAHTQIGETIGIVGSTKELGEWDVNKCIHLSTNSENYPVWFTDVQFQSNSLIKPDSSPKIEYKYVKFGADGSIKWETGRQNRWIPTAEINETATIIVEDHFFDQIQPYPYGYFEQPISYTPRRKTPDGLKIVVIGSSVTLGCSAWLLKGWAWHLEQTLHQKYGHQLVNLSVLGANMTTTLNRFAQVVIPERPDIVIIALSLGNEGLAYCPAHEIQGVQMRFEKGLEQLLKMTRALDAIPILGGLYPHADYNTEHYELLQDTHERMLNWDVPVLDWLEVLDNGQGRWRKGLSFDHAHPNTEGHRLMYEAIALSLFAPRNNKLLAAKKSPQQKNKVVVYEDNNGFSVLAYPEEMTLLIINSSTATYTITPDWQELQIAIQNEAELIQDIYLVKNAPADMPPFFWVEEERAIATKLDIPPNTEVEYQASFNLSTPKIPMMSQCLFDDGYVAVLKESDRHVWVINKTEHEYNIYPLWKQVRQALKAMPSGVYKDIYDPDKPWGTMMISKHGLESRVKLLPKSAILFTYQCALSDISRVAILPLGDYCATRMLLHKLEYDGPTFPFDLTHCTNLGDVAAIIANDFQALWNPELLDYHPDQRRLYHTKWLSLSFGHEIEETDDPLHDLTPIYERMRQRYTVRSQRFLYAIAHSDEILFVRTGCTNRGHVLDLMDTLTQKCQGKPFRLLLLAAQSGDEFADLPNVIHSYQDFNPDLMYDDLDYWMYCTSIMRSLLDSLGISSKNLFWCPATISS